MILVLCNHDILRMKKKTHIIKVISFGFLLQLSNYSSFEGVLYCQPHFDQLFKLTGSLDKSFEG